MARKLNTRFVLIASLVVGGVMILGAGAVWYHRHHRDPKKLLATAEACERDGKFVDAAKHYAGAAQLMHDPKLMTQAGDLMYKISYDDPENLGAARSYWDSAVAMDPTYSPPLEHKLAWIQEIRKRPGGRQRPEFYDTMKDVAKKILKNDPKNLPAREALPIAVIDAYGQQIETSRDDVDKAVKDLLDLQKEDANNPELPFFVALAYSVQAGKALEARTGEADQLSASAKRVMDEAIAANPNSAALHFRAALIARAQPTLPTQKEKLDAKKEAVRVEITKASELVKPDDPDYDDIKVFVSNFLENDEAVEKVLREALQNHPSALEARMRLAEIIGQRADRRDEAIKLLEGLPPPSATDRAGHRGQIYRNNELVALASLNNLRLDKLFQDNSKTAQDALLPQIETDYQKLEAIQPENPLVLRILAKMQIAKGQTTDAIATLSKAVNKTDDRNPLHYELMYLAAKCYLATGQVGSAMAYLQQIVQNFPKYDEARILLAQTQLRVNDLKSAKENIAVLAQNRPDSMDVIRMQLAVLQQEKKPEEVKTLYAKLPETNRAQKLNKANVAIILNLNDDAKRLLEGLVKENPADVEATLTLAGFYSRNKDDKNALATIDRGLQAVPNEPNLLLERARVSGSTPAELKQIRLKEAEKISDPLSRELALMSLTRDDPDQNVPLHHLQEAEKYGPKDPRVLTELYEYYGSHGNFEKASTYVDRLAEINADKVKGTLFRWRLASARANAEQDAQKRTGLLLKTQDLANQLAHDYPDFAQSWICLGQSLQALGRYDEAVSSFQSAKDKQPENPDPYRGLIQCYYELKRPDDAGKVIEEAVTTLRGSPEFKELQLQHEMRYGDPEKVVADRLQAVKDNPDNPQALMMLAQVYANVARDKNAKPDNEKESNAWLEKARAVMAQGAEKFPGELQFTALYGSLSIMLKQPEQGEKLWTTALAREQWKEKPEAIAAFADFYTIAKRPADAEKVLRDFLATPAGKANPNITLKLVDLLAVQGKTDDAMALINSIPDNTRLQLRKTELLIGQGKLADAESAIKTLMQKQNSPQLTAMLAFVYLHSNRAKESLDLLNGVIAENPAMAQALYYRAMATLRMPNANPNDALSDLVQVRDLAPENLQARYLLADCLLRLNDVESTIKELEGILRVSAGQKVARVRLMDLYSSQTPPRWLDAERVARDGEAAPELMNDPEFLASEGQLFSRHNDHEHAVRCMTAALKLQPQNTALIQAYYGVLINGKMYQQLLTESDKLPKEMKDLWWVHSLRGAAKCKMGDKDNGTQEFITAIKTAFDAKDEQAAQTVVDQLVDSTNADSALKVISALPQAAEPRWQLTIAWLQVKKNDVAGARKTLDALLANPDKLSREVHETALGFAGSVYMQLPDPDQNKSRELYLQLLKLRPNDYKIYNNLACNKSVSSAEALEYGKKAYELMQDAHTFEPLVADTYGWGLVQSGDERNLDMGLNVLLEAYGANKNIVDVAYHLGAAYVKKNNATEAEKYLSEAQVLYDEAIKNNQITDATLQPGIIQAQNEAVKLKGKKGS